MEVHPLVAVGGDGRVLAGRAALFSIEEVAPRAEDVEVEAELVGDEGEGVIDAATNRKNSVNLSRDEWGILRRFSKPTIPMSRNWSKIYRLTLKKNI